MKGKIAIGIGGWTYEPWRGTFYPVGLPRKRELEFASHALSSIEINGSYYSSFKPETWQSWHDQTPEHFVFAVKGSRYVTNRRRLADAGPSITRFVEQGLSRLGAKLGPINWQLMPTKQFNADDIAAFFALLPKHVDEVPLRHAIEVRHPSFMTPEFYCLAKAYDVAIVVADSADYPRIEQPTAAFTYARIMTTQAKAIAGLHAAQIAAIAKRMRTWSRRGDTFVYVISGAKERNPAAARALISALA